MNRPIMSLHTGSQIGVAKDVIINPHTLSVLGWWCEPGKRVLLTSEIRENGSHGVVIDDENNMADRTELHRHQEVLNLKFFLIGKDVKSSDKKIGRITDFAVDEAFIVQKLYVDKSLIKGLTSDTLLVSRSQIIEVTDKYIVIADGSVSETKKSLAEKLGVAPQSA